VLQIGELPAEEAVAAVAQIGYRENRMTERLSAPRFLMMPEVLHALGVIEDVERCELLVAAPSGERFRLPLAAQSFEAPIDWGDAGRGFPGQTPLYLRNRESHYWFEYLDEHDALYVQFNRCDNAEDETVASFAQRLQQVLDSREVNRLILDVRWNIGGSWVTTLPLIHLFVRNESLCRKGSLFALIGRHTLSATIVFLAELDKHTEVTNPGCRRA
jgi:hypothetical protein